MYSLAHVIQPSLKWAEGCLIDNLWSAGWYIPCVVRYGRKEFPMTINPFKYGTYWHVSSKFKIIFSQSTNKIQIYVGSNDGVCCNTGPNEKFSWIWGISWFFFFFLCRWNSCKQNKQGANNSTTNQNQTPSPEGEKLHSDSGISVDSQSLQEQQGQTQTHTGAPTIQSHHQEHMKAFISQFFMLWAYGCEKSLNKVSLAWNSLTMKWPNKFACLFSHVLVHVRPLLSLKN